VVVSWQHAVGEGGGFTRDRYNQVYRDDDHSMDGCQQPVGDPRGDECGSASLN
jgi:hypothetical protein